MGGIHRISRASTSAAVRSLTPSPSTSPCSIALSRRHTSTGVAKSRNHLDDPYERILPPRFPTEEERETARDTLARAVGDGHDIKLALLPFWSLAYTFYGDVFYYLPSPDNSLKRCSLPGHPFIVSSEVCALRDPALTTLQFPLAPEFFLNPSLHLPSHATPHNPPCPVRPTLDLKFLDNQPDSLALPFGSPVRFSLGPPRAVLQALYIPSPTADLKKGLDIYTLPIKLAGGVGQKAEVKRGMFPRGGTMARIMDHPQGFDRVACPIRKPLLIAYERGGRPIAAIDPLSMNLQSSSTEQGRINWDDKSSTLHAFSKVTGGTISKLSTQQFTGAHIVVASTNRDKLDWTNDNIHSLRPDRVYRADPKDTSGGGRTHLQHIRTTLSGRLERVKPSTPTAPIKATGLDEDAAAVRKKKLEDEGTAERLVLAAERQKRMRADSEHQQRMAMETDQKKREKMAAQEKRERKTNKHLEQKAAKAQRLEERIREEEKRRRLEENMAAAAAELYGSRKRSGTHPLNRSKVLDPAQHYHILGLVSLSALPSDTEIKAAWREQMQRVHPDRPGGSTEKAARVNTAFDALGTEEKRREYQRGGFWGGGRG